MRGGISTKVVDSGDRERVEIIEYWDFIGVAAVWFQNGESVGLTPPKAIFQQVVLFGNGWFERGCGRGSASTGRYEPNVPHSFFIPSVQALYLS